MLTVTSEKTSLRDLTIAELRRVAWQHIKPSEFVEDFNDLNFLSRVNYASRRTIAGWVDWGSVLSVMEEPALEFVINTRKQVSRSRFLLDSDIWCNEKQYSLEFLTKNAAHLYLDHAYQQKCITAEFIEKFKDQINYSRFFDRFLQYRDFEALREFLMYKDGLFRRYIMQSRSVRYLNRETLEALNQPVPDYFDTVITEQRIMSGQPCDDGQRSFTIWLRKFRRVTGRMNDYPTWNEMLTLMKSHPRLNQKGYVDWIMSRCLENSPEEIAQYPEQLSYRPERVQRDEYRHITGTDESTSNEDYNIEFSDVIDPPVVPPETSTDEVEDNSESIISGINQAISDMLEARITPRIRMVQPMTRPMSMTHSLAGMQILHQLSERNEEGGTDSPDVETSDD